MLPMMFCGGSPPPPAGYSANLIPTMTSNTTPSGVASSGGDINSNWQPWTAFDAIYGTFQTWYSSGIPAWIAYDWGAGNGKVITKYVITGSADGNENAARGAYSWQFQGWDGAAWVTLHSVTASVPLTSGLQVRTHTFANASNYEKYRLYVTASGSAGTGTQVQVGRLEMMSGG